MLLKCPSFYAVTFLLICCYCFLLGKELGCSYCVTKQDTHYLDGHPSGRGCQREARRSFPAFKGLKNMLGIHGCFHFSPGAAELTVLMHSGLQFEEPDL